MKCIAVLLAKKMGITRDRITSVVALMLWHAAENVLSDGLIYRTTSSVDPDRISDLYKRTVSRPICFIENIIRIQVFDRAFCNGKLPHWVCLKFSSDLKYF